MNEYLSQTDVKGELIANKEMLKGSAPTVIKIGGSIAAESTTIFSVVVFLHKAIGVPLVIVQEVDQK